MLSHDEKEFARKVKQVRGMWHEANFEDAEVRRAAATAAERLHWECVEKEVVWEAKIGDTLSAKYRQACSIRAWQDAIANPSGCNHRANC